MKYKLIGSGINVVDTILKNRGIKSPEEYLRLTDSCIHNYIDISESLSDGLDLLLRHIHDNSHIHIIVDCDVDGNTSASMLYLYIKNTLRYNNMSYSIHTGKAHGITDEIIIPNETKLVLIPDAGTNDVQQCKLLGEKGIEVLVIDHHLEEERNPFATIINNQTSNYTNKNLCGAGVAYKFLQALDDRIWENDADNYLDLVAIAHIADIMDMRDYETRRLVTKGLQRIEHPLLKAFIAKRSYDLSSTDVPTAIDIAFYITPLINAIIRSGTQDEKDLLFKAFIMEYEEFDYKPRRKSKDDPEPETVKESIYDRVARLSLNAKSRQNKSKEKSVNCLTEKYGSKLEWDTISVVNVTDVVQQELTGLVAMEIAKKYNKPCLALRKREDGLYSGSGRNVNDCCIENLKNELDESGLCEWTAGHEGAFGLCIKRENIPKITDYFNQKYEGKMDDKTYKVDFIKDNITYNFIKEIEEIKWLYCSFIEEPKMAVKDLIISPEYIEVFGKEPKRHWKFEINGIEYIKFNIPDEDELTKIDDIDCEITITLIGTVRVNKFAQKVTPQFIVTDYEITERGQGDE